MHSYAKFIGMKRMSITSFTESFACIQMQIRNFVYAELFYKFSPRRIKGGVNW